jgi:succinate dehydrogenase/fumarate reductase flavoprotein subunit
MMKRRELATEVLVIGNGGAGLRAAVEAAERGRRVVLVSKIGTDRPNSTAVIAGWGAQVAPGDVESYFRMVVEEGNYLSDQELAWQYACEVAERMPELRRFGVSMRLAECTLERPGTKRELWFFEGPGGRLGDALRIPLREAALQKGVTILSNFLVTRLLTSDAGVTGAIALDLTTGDLLVIPAKAVILATGGASGIYARQNNPAGTTGDGYALAYRVGAELVDMEFDTFMMSHDELEALFAGQLNDEDALSTAGAHHSCGGIRVDLSRRSTVPGLYAAGEVAGGTFGAARLGGSAVGDIIVSGHVAGRAAAEAAGSIPEPRPDPGQVSAEEERLGTLLRRGGIRARSRLDQLRRVMWQQVGPVRREASLTRALQQLRAVRAEATRVSAPTVADLRDAVELDLMLDVSEVIAAAALARRESRGNHWRLDYREPDNASWLNNLVVRRAADGRPEITATQVALTRMTDVGPCRVGSAWSGGYVGGGW